MTNRTVRIGELMQKELSELLHSRWRAESVTITLTKVDVSPDLRKSWVYYSVIGGREEVARAGKLLFKVRGDLKVQLGKRITLKYMPDINFVYDPSIERGVQMIGLMQEIEEEDER